ncbi:MAG TPA: hypothetical protein VGH40_10060 [Roseiarcus sp.]|jgi:hypothetical protein
MANKYVFLYSGGDMPRSEAEGKAMMDAWMAWFGKAGPSIVDGGAPLASASKIIGNGKTSGASGYSIITADSLDAAVNLTDNHPHLAHGGGIEVLECVKIPGM